jgi:hypothetical protein
MKKLLIVLVVFISACTDSKCDGHGVGTSEYKICYNRFTQLSNLNTKISNECDMESLDRYPWPKIFTLRNQAYPYDKSTIQESDLFFDERYNFQENCYNERQISIDFIGPLNY